MQDQLPYRHAVRLLSQAQRVTCLLGAGVSTNAGIPDFRSPGGLFEKYGQEIFYLSNFKRDPQRFYEFMGEFYRPDQWHPTPTHRFVKWLEDQGRLLRCYTQNIDGLEEAAGLSADRVVQVHGGFKHANCAQCRRHRIPLEELQAALAKEPGAIRCPRCRGARGAYLKPEVVFYGENLPTEFSKAIKADYGCKLAADGKLKRFSRGSSDLLVVIGTSLQVSPVNLLPQMANGRTIYINLEPLPRPRSPEYCPMLLGDCDQVCQQLMTEVQLIWERLEAPEVSPEVALETTAEGDHEPPASGSSGSSSSSSGSA